MKSRKISIGLLALSIMSTCVLKSVGSSRAYSSGGTYRNVGGNASRAGYSSRTNTAAGRGYSSSGYQASRSVSTGSTASQLGTVRGRYGYQTSSYQGSKPATSKGSTSQAGVRAEGYRYARNAYGQRVKVGSGVAGDQKAKTVQPGQPGYQAGQGASNPVVEVKRDPATGRVYYAPVTGGSAGTSNTSGWQASSGQGASGGIHYNFGDTQSTQGGQTKTTVTQPGQPNYQPGQPGYQPGVGQPGYQPGQPNQPNYQPGQPGYQPRYGGNEWSGGSYRSGDRWDHEGKRYRSHGGGYRSSDFWVGNAWGPYVVGAALASVPLIDYAVSSPYQDCYIDIDRNVVCQLDGSWYYAASV